MSRTAVTEALLELHCTASVWTAQLYIEWTGDGVEVAPVASSSPHAAADMNDLTLAIVSCWIWAHCRGMHSETSPLSPSPKAAAVLCFPTLPSPTVRRLPEAATAEAAAKAGANDLRETTVGRLLGDDLVSERIPVWRTTSHTRQKRMRQSGRRCWVG